MTKHILISCMCLSFVTMSTFADEGPKTIGHNCLQNEFTHVAAKCMRNLKKEMQSKKINNISDQLINIASDLKDIIKQQER